MQRAVSSVAARRCVARATVGRVSVMRATAAPVARRAFGGAEIKAPEEGMPFGQTGLEKEEAEGAFQKEILLGAFGTKENPVIVPSIFDMRIVGCEGGQGDSAHDLIWHSVVEGKPTVCLECGQYFQHKRIEPKHHGAGEH